MNQKSTQISKDIDDIDKVYSNRFIVLDPNGYCLIKLSENSNEIIVEHYTNTISDSGIALDPETNQPISCNEVKKRSPKKIYKGKSAKEVGIQLTEGEAEHPISKLDHALYLGRELQKAEFCLIHQLPYIQD